MVVPAESQELFGGREPVVGLEAFEVSAHDVDEEAYGGPAALGLETYEVGELLVEWRVRRHVWVRGAGGLVVAVAVVGGVAVVWGEAVIGDVGSRVVHAELEQLSGGVEPVAWLGVFELSLHGVDEEPDDESSAVGLLADDVGERGVSVLAGVIVVLHGLRSVRHVFYIREWRGGLSRGIHEVEGVPSAGQRNR